MKISKLLSVIVLFGLAACASSMKDIVLERSDGLSKRPDWVKESNAFVIEKGTVYSLGSTTIPANARPEAGFRIAENNAKGAIAGAIEQRLNFMFQNAEEGLTMDATQTRFIGAEVSKLTTSSIRPGKRYWEKVAVVTDAEGERTVQYRVFAQVTMPEADFKKAIQEALRRAEGGKGLSEEFRERVDRNWDEFVQAP